MVSLALHLTCEPTPPEPSQDHGPVELTKTTMVLAHRGLHQIVWASCPLSSPSP